MPPADVTRSPEFRALQAAFYAEQITDWRNYWKDTPDADTRKIFLGRARADAWATLRDRNKGFKAKAARALATRLGPPKRNPQAAPSTRVRIRYAAGSRPVTWLKYVTAGRGRSGAIQKLRAVRDPAASTVFSLARARLIIRVMAPKYPGSFSAVRA